MKKTQPSAPKRAWQPMKLSHVGSVPATLGGMKTKMKMNGHHSP